MPLDSTPRPTPAASAACSTSSPEVLHGYGDAAAQPDAFSKLELVCLSHLRWDSVFQRPQQLMSRCARDRRVFFVEEPVPADADGVDVTRSPEGVFVVVPRLAAPQSPDAEVRLRGLLDRALQAHRVREYVAWYYTPMALGFTRHLAPAAIVYDCMDELSAFAGAPRSLRSREEELLKRADLVLTGGRSLYEAKRGRHHNLHAFPSSVDVAHFARARAVQADPEDQAGIPRPRLGFFGVLDERLDLQLVAGVAAARPAWHVVLIGPVAKIDRALLPAAHNIHYLGRKSYSVLPSYLAGWDVALVPFALNDATRFISPTKTPEYLAAGKPVVSTSIRDIVYPYGHRGLVRIADNADAFAAAVDEALHEAPGERMRRVDRFLADMSWDRTWSDMLRLVRDAIHKRQRAARTVNGAVPGVELGSVAPTEEDAA